MNKEIKEKWVAALRSGKYRQGKKVLNHYNESFCCLGVLCELAIEENITQKYDDLGITYGKLADIFYPPLEVCVWAGLFARNPEINGYRLASYNDELNKNFIEIADLIEKHL